MTDDSFSYKHLGVKVSCENDEVRCSDYFEQAVLDQRSPDFVQADSKPMGDRSEGDFTFKLKKDSANGTLDFMNTIVDRGVLNLTEDNYQIVDDKLTYNFNGLELTC